MAKTNKGRILGIRIKDESDLDSRFKNMAKKLGLSHAALLGKWVAMEEAEPRGVLGFFQKMGAKLGVQK